MSVNKAFILGRLGKDPELRQTTSGKSCCTFSVATSERWTDQSGNKQESTTWHNIVAWGKQAEVMKEYLSKGSQVWIEGRIDNRSYDKKDGTKGYTSEVVVQNFQFVGGKAAPYQSEQSGGNAPIPGPQQTANTGVGADDDLPF